MRASNGQRSFSAAERHLRYKRQASKAAAAVTASIGRGCALAHNVAHKVLRSAAAARAPSGGPSTSVHSKDRSPGKKPC